ncbi:MAG: ComEC family competence protein [Prevotellaceae bacterium]|jgi:competence protein ComEC|nr:ComEC family competence protein [Prevotellaceae bacterium]
MRHSDIINGLCGAPFVRLLLPFSVGMACQLQWGVQWSGTTWLCPAFFALMLLASRFNTTYPNRWMFGLCANLFLACAGLALAQSLKQQSELPTARPICIAAVVSDEPSLNARYAKLTVSLRSYRDSLNCWHNVDEQLILYLRTDTAHTLPALGDLVVANVKAMPHAAPKNPHEFDFGQYQRQRGIFHSAFISASSCAVVAHGCLPLWKSAPKHIRRQLLGYFAEQGMEGEELAVLQALTLGDKSMLDSDLRQSYAAAGAMHILAVSGMHVGIVSMILGYCLTFLERRRSGRLLKGAIVLLCIWLYALVAGFSPSVFRASMMFTVLTLGGMLGRRTNTYNTLAFAAFLTCALDPQALFNAGFQLSYAAVLAILFFHPRLYDLLHFKRWLPDAVWSLICVSLAANIGTLPISVYLFHQLPLYFLLTNLLVTLPVTAIMVGFLATLPFAFLPSIPLVGWLTAKLTGYCIVALNFIVRGVESLPYSLLEALWFTPAQTWLLLLAVAAMAFFIWTKRRNLLLVSLALTLVFVGLHELRQLSLRQQKVMAVYCVKGVSLVTLVDGNRALALCDSSWTSNDFNFHLKSHCAALGIARYDSFRKVALHQAFSDSVTDGGVHKGFVRFAGKTLRVAHHEPPCTMQQPIEVDYLVMSSACRLRPRQLLAIYNPRHIILDSSLPPYLARRHARDFATLGHECHNVGELGAFVCSW